MDLLYFEFFKKLEGVDIRPFLRVSLWKEESNPFLMPCEFLEVNTKDDYYMIKVNALLSEEFKIDYLIGQKFLFGHPGKIIGIGVLIKLEKKV